MRLLVSQQKKLAIIGLPRPQYASIYEDSNEITEIECGNISKAGTPFLNFSYVKYSLIKSESKVLLHAPCNIG
jgi:hypothetical protein